MVLRSCSADVARWQMRRGAKRCLVPLRTVAGLLTACIALVGCGSSAPSKSGARDSTCRGKLGGGVSYITAWFHASSSVGAEWQTLVRQVAEFNHSQRAVHVRLITLPEGEYSREVATAAASGTYRDRSRLRRTESLQLRLGRRPQADRLVPLAAPAGGLAAVNPPAGDLRRSNVGRRDVRLGTWVVCAALDPSQSGDLDPDRCVPGMDGRAVHPDPGASTSDRL